MTNKKLVLKSIVSSILMSFAIFCLTGIAFDIANKGEFILEGYGFTKMVLGCIAVGVGFGAPTTIYKNDKLPMPTKALIHVGIGVTVLTAVSYAVGWAGNSGSIAKELLNIGCRIALALVLWFLYIRRYRKEAERMNARIKSME